MLRKGRGHVGVCSAALVVLGISTLVLSWAQLAAGQGLQPSPDRFRASPQGRAFANVRNARVFRSAFLRNPKIACSDRRGASLCASSGSASATVAMEQHGQLVLAASPLAYSSLNLQQTGGIQLIGPVRDQSVCDTCVGFAMAGAAQSALAAVMRTPVSRWEVSVQDLYFCSPSARRACKTPWNLQAAAKEVSERQLLPWKCLPYQPDFKDELTTQQVCRSSCNDSQPFAASGSFAFARRDTPWGVQQHIRRYGAVATRFEVYDDFREFFNSSSNRNKIYTPRPNATLKELHAVLLVGYDNEKEYWLAQNSWGTGFADGGFFRVAYGTCGVLVGDEAEVVGLEWKPEPLPDTLKLPVTRSNISADCYWYQPSAGAYLAQVSWQAGIPLDQLLLNNTDRVLDLDAALPRLLLCNPAQGSILVAGGPSSQRPNASPGAPGRNCSTYDTCYDCQGASNCVWCFEGLPGRGQKPSCQPSTASCGRRVSSRSDCPVDGTAGRAGTTAAEAGVTCASLSNCRQCLRYTYQCRWCITGSPSGYPSCQAGATSSCDAWYGASARECPRDGDPGALEGWTSCNGIKECSRCLQYSGAKPQCVWCDSTQACLPAGGVGVSTCQRLLQKAPVECPAPKPPPPAAPASPAAGTGAAARAVQDPCTSQSNCYRCQSTPGCTWCYSGWPAPLDKPSCISSLSECSGFVKSIQECPVDRIPAATAAAGSSTAVTCASLSSCRECLRFTYQCRWCVTDPPGGRPLCQNQDTSCGAWWGQAPRECPADG